MTKNDNSCVLALFIGLKGHCMAKRQLLPIVKQQFLPKNDLAYIEKPDLMGTIGVEERDYKTRKTQTC